MRLSKEIFKLSLLTITLVFIGHVCSAYSLLGYKWAGGAYNYKINPNGVDNSVDYSSKTATITSAAAVWTTVSTTEVGVSYQGTTTDTGWGVLNYQNTVTWVTNGWSGNVIGISTSWYSGDKKILDSDIKLNTSFANDSRLPALVTHEVGHSLGIGHTAEYGDSPTTEEYHAIMYYLLHSQNSLNEHDNCAITAIYPKSGGGCTPTYSAGKFPIPCCGSTGVTVAFSNNSYTYDGNDHYATVTTTPAGISHTVTYFDQFLNVISNPTNAGIFSVRVDITQSGYESEGPFFGSLTISPKTLHVYASNTSVNYGDSEPIYPLTYSGFISGESKLDLISEPYGYINQTWPVVPGYYTIYCNYGASQNYSFVYHTGTLTVNGLSVNSVSFSNTNYTYDGLSKEVTVTVDPSNVNYSLEYYKSGIYVSNQKDAGNYEARVTITEPGYNPSSYTGSLNIQKATINATADNQVITYGDNEPVYSISYSGFVNGENSSVIDVLPIASINGVGPLLPGSYPIIVSGGSDTNYDFNYQNGLLTVLEKAVNSVTINNTNQVYTGKSCSVTVVTNPVGLAANVVYYDINNQVITAPIDAGSYSVKVTITEPGYRQDLFQSNLTIAKASLIAKVDSVELDYGKPKPAFTFKYSGFVNGETVAVIDEVPTANVAGTWPLLPGKYPIVALGGQDNNYSITLHNSTLTVNSNGMIVVNVENTSHVYDGTAKAIKVSTIPAGISYNVVYKDALNNVTSNMTDAGIYFYTVSINEPGYDAVSTSGNLTIEKATLRVEAVDEQIYFGAPEPVYKYNIIGFVNNETTSVLDVQPQISIGGVGPLLPGSYTIFVSGGAARNYAFNYSNGTLTVKPLVVQQIKVTKQKAEYTGTPHYIEVETIPQGIAYQISYSDLQNKPVVTPINAGDYLYKIAIVENGYEATSDSGIMVIEKKPIIAKAPGGVIAYGELPSVIPAVQYDGFVAGEGAEVIDVPAQLSISGTWPLAVGEYEVDVFGAQDDNYHVNYQRGKLNVEKAKLTVKATSYELKYGDPVPTISYTISGFVGNDNLSVLESLPKVELNGYSEPEPGTYLITVSGASDENYDFVYEDGILKIEPIGMVALTVSSLNYEYDGKPKAVAVETNPLGINYEVNYPELNAGELPVNAGKYKVVATVVERGYLHEKYESELSIGKAPLQVQTRDVQVLQGDDEPFYPVEISGFVNGENESVLISKPTATIGLNWPVEPGTYPIVLLGGEAANYWFNYIDGKLTMIPARKVVVVAGENGYVKAGEESSLTKSISLRIAEGSESPAFYAIADTNYKFDKWDDGNVENPRKMKNIFTDFELKALFKLTVDVIDFQNNQGLALHTYPNPVRAFTNFRIEVQIEELNPEGSEIIISDIAGRIINKISKVQMVNHVNGLPAGAYQIALRINGKIQQQNRLLVKY